MAVVSHPLKDWMSAQAPVDILRLQKANGWLRMHLPELYKLYGIPQGAEYHPEIDTGIHIELTLEVATRLSDEPRVRYAALVHDLGKGITPPDQWPRHIGHEEAGMPVIEAVGERLSLPEDWTWLAVTVSQWHLRTHRIFESKASTIVKWLRDAGFLDNASLFEEFLLVCQADKQGRLGRGEVPYPQADFLRACHAKCLTVTTEDPARLHEARVSALKGIQREHGVPVH